MDAEDLLGPLTDEWIYRHQHYWSLLFRFGLVSVFVLAIPWLIGSRVRADLGGFVYAFPVASLWVTGWSTWLLNEEYARARVLYNKIKELRGKDDPPYTRKKGRRTSPRIGSVVVLLYAPTLIALAIAAFVLLVRS